MGRNEAFAPLQVFLAVVGDPLGKFLGMCQKKVEVEGACSSQHRASSLQSGSFLAIGSSLVALAQVQEQFGGACGLSHPLALPRRTKVLDPL